MFTWLWGRKSNPHPVASRPGCGRCRSTRTTWPRLEALEDRVVLSTALVDLPFQQTGEVAGAEFDIAAPANWNGTLLVLATGGGGDDLDHPSETPFAELFDDPIP